MGHYPIIKPTAMRTPPGCWGGFFGEKLPSRLKKKMALDKPSALEYLYNVIST
jgi:hypothetical protein